MSRKITYVLPVILTIVLLALGAATPAYGQTGLPNYQLQYLGNGSPVAINNTGRVAGARIVGSNYQPLVSVDGALWTLLPVPTGAESVFPTDINDSGVIVGVAYTAWNPVAVRWNPSGSSYTVEVLPRLPGDPSSYATAINNLGQIVGARRALGYVPASSTGWLYSDALGVVDLLATYGLAPWPAELNDNGQVISGIERLDLNTGVIDVVGNGPTNYNPVSGVAINNNGQIVGSASLRSTSLNIVSVFRYEGAAGWRFIAGSSRYTTASSINSAGDIGYGELGAGLYLSNVGTYAVNSLLDPAVVAAGWSITGSGVELNDQRQIATVGRNSITGQSGGVLLTPLGSVAVPTTPINLQGVAHSASSTEPWNSIDLTWENTSSLTTGYELERREAGTVAWAALTLSVPPSAANTSHTDTTVGVGVTYEYRVRALGVAGASEWSIIATATAPVTALDTTPPIVTVLSPANGATVSGLVAVSAQATDNVAVEYLEISYWNQYLGQQMILGSVSNSGALTVNWDTRSLTPAAYTARAYAYDALGNWTQTEVTVNVTAQAKSLKVSLISLSGTVSGNKVNLTGDVYIKDGNNRSVSNANVTIRWTLPNGTIKTILSKTNTAGRARFTISGSRGTYTLTVTGVTKSGYVFDAAGSVLSQSITR